MNSIKKRIIEKLGDEKENYWIIGYHNYENRWFNYSYRSEKHILIISKEGNDREKYIFGTKEHIKRLQLKKLEQRRNV